MAKAKAVPKTDNGTITRDKAGTPPTPKASEIEKTQSFTAAFRVDAHVAADHFLGGREEVSREESDVGDDGTRVTITYK